MILFVRQKLIIYAHRLGYVRNALCLIATYGIMGFFPFSACACVLTSQSITFTQQQYGLDGVQRLKDWCTLINTYKDKPDLVKLRLTTDFFNRVPYGDDETIWGVKNYWATPIEFLGKFAGDCEDYVIAKYLTLIAMGVSPDKMRMVYVVSSKLSISHMVLAYYTEQDGDPLILDSMNSWIKFASERPDLRPIYMFNDKGLWMSNNGSQAKQVASGSHFIEWQSVLIRMHQQGLTKDDLAS